MIIIKDSQVIDNMRVAGKLLASVMELAEVKIKPKVSTLEIDEFIEKNMLELGMKCVCKGYCGYKHASCISINDVVIHGIPSKDIVLKNGDLVKIDIAGSYKNYCVDMTRCFFVGKVIPKVHKIVDVAQNALDVGISHIRPGVHLSDISSYIQQEVENEGFGIVRNFAGHGIGKSLHEAPEIPNFGKPGEGPILKSGMTLAIEPMITEGDYKVKIDKDGWTIRTADGGLAAHVEDTVLVNDNGFEILTRKK